MPIFPTKAERFTQTRICMYQTPVATMYIFRTVSFLRDRKPLSPHSHSHMIILILRIDKLARYGSKLPAHLKDYSYLPLQQRVVTRACTYYIAYSHLLLVCKNRAANMEEQLSGLVRQTWGEQRLEVVPQRPPDLTLCGSCP